MRRTVWLAAFFVTLVATSPAVARVAVAVGFCETYIAPDGSTCTHRGVDLPARPESPVLSPISGTVRFAGRTPGPHGGTIHVVSLDTVSGIVTMLPFADIEVERGAQLQRGDVLGTLAAGGDPSSPGSHLHLGLKRGGVYLDPSPLLAFWQDAESGDEPVATASPDAEVSVGTAASAAPIRPSSEHVVSRAPAVDVVGDTSTALRDTTPGMSISQGVSIAPVKSAAAAIAPTTASRPQRQVTESPRPVAEGAAAKAERGDSTVGLTSSLVWAAVCAGALIGGLALARRAFISEIERGGVSDRLGRLLQHLRAGDTLCGLTSCSGPLPSQSRSH